METEQPASESTKDRDVIHLTADRLRMRADRLRKSARFTIVMIVGVLIGGIVIFISAGRIASNEAQISSKKALLAEKRADLADRQRTVVRSQMQVLDFENGRKEITGEGGSRRQGIGPVAAQKENQVNRARRDLDKAQHALDMARKDAQSLEAEIAQIGSSNEPLQFDRTQVPVLISAIVTRIGSIVLLLFLVKILVPLYRYNTKLSAYYDAQMPLNFSITY
jgi:hypothetical protein